MPTDCSNLQTFKSVVRCTRRATTNLEQHPGAEPLRHDDRDHHVDRHAANKGAAAAALHLLRCRTNNVSGLIKLVMMYIRHHKLSNYVVRTLVMPYASSASPPPADATPRQRTDVQGSAAAGRRCG